MPTAESPLPTLRRSFALAMLATVLATGAAGLALTGSLLGMWAAIALPMALGALTVGTLPRHGQPSMGPANAVTLTRAVLAGAVAGVLVVPEPEALVLPVLVLSALAFALDAVDGRVARATGTSSPFGALLDMELDGLFILALCVLAWQLDRAGAWVLGSGALRYAFIAASWVWPWMNRPLYETRRRAFICGVQVSTLWLCLVPWTVPGVSQGLAAAGLVALVYSFGADTRWLFQHRNDP